MANVEPLRAFVHALTHVVDSHPTDETQTLDAGAALLEQLIRRDDWLPERFARADPEHYSQYLLYGDPQRRFAVVSFVWGPGQSSPIHDHTVWGLIGVLRGAEICEEFDLPVDPARPSRQHRLEVGEVDRVSPSIGDVHRVANAHEDRATVSIHVYGGDIGTIRRHVYDAAGRASEFVSGYTNDAAPDLV